MLKSNRLGVFEIANRVVINNTTDAVVEGLAGHQSEKNTSAHEVSNISGLQAALNGKADNAHTHSIADVTGLETALNGKQDIISGYTGTIDIVVSVDFANQTSKTAQINVSNGIIISIN